MENSFAYVFSKFTWTSDVASMMYLITWSQLWSDIGKWLGSIFPRELVLDLLFPNFNWFLLLRSTLVCIEEEKGKLITTLASSTFFFKKINSVLVDRILGSNLDPLHDSQAGYLFSSPRTENSSKQVSKRCF